MDERRIEAEVQRLIKMLTTDQYDRESLLSTKAVATYFGVSEATIKRWANSGRLTCARGPGGHRKFRLEDVVRAGIDISDRRALRESQAARWFNVYVSERPSGRFVREALGRLIEAEQRTGNIEAARAASRRYLASYADGPHAPLARSILLP